MKQRALPAHQLTWPEIGLGCWQLGGGWGNPWSDEIAQQTLQAAYDTGTRFFDTADVYDNGASERSIGKFLRTHDACYVATKLGRLGLYPDKYTEDSLRAATLKSLGHLGLSSLPLTQLHCVPTAVLREGKVFDWLREQKREGLIENFGASVESVEEGLICLEQEGLISLQIIFNIFRQKPLEELLPKAKARGVGIIVRLPLASGLLAGKMSRDTVFNKKDHRSFNRDGKFFNVGETFAGLPYEKGVDLAEELKGLLPEDLSLVQMSLRWILDHEAVTVVIPGASSAAQAQANAAMGELSPLPDSLHEELGKFYQDRVRSHIRGPY